MTKANDLASLLDANGDVVSSALDNVPASDLVNDTTPQLGGTLDTNTNDINFGTNVKSNYGTSAQLMMYHDGSNGWIKGNNTGNNSIAIQSGGTGSVMISGSSGQNIISQQGDAAYLHHAGFAKLITTATGVDVTGTVTADGLTVDGTATINGAAGIPLTLNSTGNTNLQFNEGGALRWYIRNVTGSNDFNFYGNGSSRLNIGSDGDISFYNTSGTAKLSWDASSESLGIGLTPEARLDVFGNSDVTAALKIGPNANFGHHFYDSSTNGDLVIKREESGVQNETMRLTRSGGKVGINSTVTPQKLTVVDNNDAEGFGVYRNYTVNAGAGTYFYLGRKDGSGNLLPTVRLFGYGNGNSTTSGGGFETHVRNTSGTYTTVTSHTDRAFYINQGAALIHKAHNSNDSRYEKRRHVLTVNTAASSVQIAFMRIKRQWWGSGNFEIHVRGTYYDGSNDETFQLQGHSSTQYAGTMTAQHMYGDGNTSRIYLSSRVDSGSPADGTVGYQDVYISVPAYETYSIEVITSYSTWVDTDSQLSGELNGYRFLI